MNLNCTRPWWKHALLLFGVYAGVILGSSSTNRYSTSHVLICFNLGSMQNVQGLWQHVGCCLSDNWLVATLQPTRSLRDPHVRQNIVSKDTAHRTSSTKCRTYGPPYAKYIETRNMKDHGWFRISSPSDVQIFGICICIV